MRLKSQFLQYPRVPKILLFPFASQSFPLRAPTWNHIQISPHTSAKKTNCSVSRRAKQGWWILQHPIKHKVQWKIYPSLWHSSSFSDEGFGWNSGENMVQGWFFLHWGYWGSYSLSMCLVVWKLKDLSSEKSVLKIWRGPPSVSTYFLRK